MEINGMKVLPANLDLARLETEMAALPKRELILKNRLSAVSDVQYIIIDCPPASGLLTINALVALPGSFHSAADGVSGAQRHEQALEPD